MRKEQFAKFPLEFGRGIIQHCREKFFLRRKIAPQSTLRSAERSRDPRHGGGSIAFFEKGSARDFQYAGPPLRFPFFSPVYFHYSLLYRVYYPFFAASRHSFVYG